MLELIARLASWFDERVICARLEIQSDDGRREDVESGA